MQKYLSAEDREERGSRTKIAMLNFKQNAPIERIDFTNINDLAKGLSWGNEMDDDIHARLYVVEDLSRDVIEALGSHFDVDPHFFRGHISHYMWYNTRDPWVELPDLEIVSRKRSYFHVRYVQSRYFRDQFSLSEAKRETGGFNILRKMDRDDNWVPNFDIPNSDVGLVRSKTSLWIRPRTENEKGVLGKFTRLRQSPISGRIRRLLIYSLSGILLVDPTVTNGYHLWGGYRNFEDCPSISQTYAPTGPPRNSIFEDVIYYTSTLSPEEIAVIPNDPRLLFKRTALLICAEWYTLVTYATTRLSQLQWELENPEIYGNPGGLQVSIKKLHCWRRRLPIFRILVSELLEQYIKRDHFMGGSKNHIIDLQRDFEIVLSNIENLQGQADQMMAVVTAAMSIDESKKALEQNRSLNRLTWLAVIFIPLSFVASLFSMNGDLSTLLPTMRIFFAVALPLTIVVLLLTRFAKPGR